MTTQTIINHLNAIERTRERHKEDKTFPMPVLFAIMQNYRTLYHEYETFDSLRRSLMEGIGDKPEPEAEQAAVSRQINELLATDIPDIPLRTIPLAQLESIETLTLDDIMSLEFMIRDEKGE